MATEDTVPGLVLDPALQAKLDGLGDDLKPIEKDLKEGDKQPEDTKKETGEEDDPAKEKEGGDEKDKPAEDDAGKEVPEDDDGFTIDGDEEDEPAKEEVPDTSGDKASDVKLTPEQTYILEGLGAMKVTGTVNDKAVEATIVTTEQLPNGFKFDNITEERSALALTARNETLALQRKAEFQGQENVKTAKEFKDREDNADRADIGQMQRDKTIPTFKAQPDSKEWSTDPANVLVQEVLDFKEQQNNKYMEEFNAGRPYKHIGFTEAFAMYKRENPVDDKQAKEDKERLEAAKRGTGGKGDKVGDTTKPRVHSGMSSMDLDRMIEGLDWA